MAFNKNEYMNKYYSRPDVLEKYRKQQENTKLAVFSTLGHRCIKCGFDDIRALQLDHIKGDGAEWRRNHEHTAKSRRQYYNYLMQNPDYLLTNIQILCANCNWIKRHENNENGGCLN